MYNPLDEKWLYDGDLPVEPEGFSLDFCRMSPEEQSQVISDVADDLEQNYTVAIEDGYAVLKAK